MRLVVDNDTPATVTAERRAMLAKVHVARKALGIEEDDYRELLTRVTGKRSAKDCNNHQLTKAMAEFERMGFQAVGRASKRVPAGSPTARKARAMWISLAQLGAVADSAESALEAFARRQLGVDRLQWADERQGYRLIEALKAMADRFGWNQRIPARLPKAESIRILKARLVGAQLAILATAGVKVTGPLAADRADWSDKQLESAAAELAVRIRFIAKPT